MDLDILKSWDKSSKFRTIEEIEFWDKKAKNYGLRSQNITFDNDQYLKYLQEEIGLKKEYDVLDIGCGPGLYTFPLAAKTKSVTGIDISPKMLERAKESAEEKGVTNVDFLERNWADCDMAEFDSKFDLVIARTTPALCDFNTMERIIKASRDLCVITTHSWRTMSVYDRLASLLGIEQKRSDIPAYVFAIAWQFGYSPKVSYMYEKFEITEDFNDVYKESLGRLKRTRDLTEKEQELVFYDLKEQSKDGKVTVKIQRELINIAFSKKKS